MYNYQYWIVLERVVTDIMIMTLLLKTKTIDYRKKIWNLYNLIILFDNCHIEFNAKSNMVLFVFCFRYSYGAIYD